MLPPRMYGHTDTIPSLLRPQGSALNSIFFFLTWLLPPQRAGVPLGEGVVAPLCIPPSIPPSIPAEPGLRGPPLPPVPVPARRAPKGSLLCGLWPQQRLAHLQKRLKRGTAARRCGDRVTWQKHAVPGAAGPAGLGWRGLPKRGAPESSLGTILPAGPWGSPGSLRNKLIQITAREIYTRREPLPAAVLWEGAPALPCPGQRLGSTPRPAPPPHPGHYKIQSPAKQRRPLTLQGSPHP